MPLVAADAQTQTASAATTSSKSVADYLGHANTMYWISRARPWSLTEVERAIEYYKLAEEKAEAQQPPNIQELLHEIAQGSKQLETMRNERSDQLGSWSPFYGPLFGQDEIYEWYDEPVEVAAERIAASILHADTRIHMQNDQPFMIIQTDLGLLEDEFGGAAQDAVHAYINNNKPYYALSDRELATHLNPTLLQNLKNSPPDPESLQTLARGLDSAKMSVDQIGILTLVHNDTVDNLYYLGGYFQLWPTTLPKQNGITPIAQREWYVDGFVQKIDFKEILIYLLLLLGLIWQPVIVSTLRLKALDQDVLGHTPKPPYWAIAVAIIGGFVFSSMAKIGLTMATPDLEMLHPTLLSVTWIAGSSVVLMVLPILLVYVTATRFNAIAARLGNSDMVAILLVGSWYGAQVHLVLQAAPVEGLGHAIAILSLPALLGSLTLVGIARSWCLWNRSGSHWDMAITIAGIAGIAVASILEVRGTWPASIAAGFLPPAFYLGTLLIKYAWTTRNRGDEVGAPEASEVGLLHDPPFIDTVASTQFFDSLLESVLGEAASDDAIEIVWLEGDRGCGKTRIAKELAERIMQMVINGNLADDTIVLFGDCNEPGDPEADIPYEPLRQAFSELMGVHRFGNPAENARRMQGALSKVASSASIAGSAISVALDLAGSDDENFVSANEGMIADEMVEVLGHTVMPGSDHPNGRRVVLIIDDIQWIDDDSLRVLNILLERLVDRFVSVETIMQNRVCILMTCRTDVSADSEGEPDQVAAAQAKLEELSQRGVVNLITPEPVHDILGTDENSLEWRNQLLNTIRCTERARRGISREMELKGLELPLHRLEFIKIAIAQGALKIVDGRIDLEPSIPLHDISPGTEFRDMVANELKGLDRQLLDILHCCAIIGRSFQISLVAKIFDIDIIELLSLLKEAESRKIVIDCTKADDIYEFRDKRIAGAFRAKSGLDPTEVQQMAREYHRRFVLIRGGELDAKYARESSIPFTEVLAIATHAATVAESMPLETIRWSRMAAARCEQRRLYGRAIRELEPALSLINNRDDLAIPTLQRIELFLMHAQLTLDAEEQADLALASLEQAQCLLDRCVDADDEINHRISLLRGLAMYQQRRFSDAANTVQAVADDPSAPVWMGARAHFVIALSMDPRTQAADKHQVLEELLTATITAIKESTDPLATHHLILLQSEICNSLGMSRLHHAGDTQGAQEIFQRSIELNRSPRVADRKGEAIGHGGLGDVYKTTGRIEEARDSYELNLSISRETGDVAGIMRMTSMLGGIAMEEYESETTQAERARHLNEARRYYEESALLAVKSKRTIALKFALEGLIRIEVAEKASGAMLVQTIEEAITEGSVDTMVADAVLQAIADVELPATAIEQIKTLLKPLAS